MTDITIRQEANWLFRDTKGRSVATSTGSLYCRAIVAPATYLLHGCHRRDPQDGCWETGKSRKSQLAAFAASAG